MAIAGATNPLLTIVVPTYERPALLERCLRALTAQDLPLDRFEVVVVDDGSAEPPRQLVQRFAQVLQVRLHEQANAGPAAARNAGAAEARGEYIVFTDDDCLPDRRWLTVLADVVVRNPACAVGGRVVNAMYHELCASASQLLIEYLYDYYNAAGAHGRFFITSNLAFPTASFRALGGFDAAFPLAAAEDRDMCERWREEGYDMVYAEGAIVRHAHSLELRSFCRQHFTYGRGAYHLQQARVRRGQLGGLRREPMQFYLGLLRYPLSRGWGARALAQSALLGLSQGVYVLGYLTERSAARRQRTRREASAVAQGA
jgi:GT2 family glycosyltransferase